MQTAKRIVFALVVTCFALWVTLGDLVLWAAGALPLNWWSAEEQHWLYNHYAMLSTVPVAVVAAFGLHWRYRSDSRTLWWLLAVTAVATLGTFPVSALVRLVQIMAAGPRESAQWFLWIVAPLILLLSVAGKLVIWRYWWKAVRFLATTPMRSALTPQA